MLCVYGVAFLMSCFHIYDLKCSVQSSGELFLSFYFCSKCQSLGDQVKIVFINRCNELETMNWEQWLNI